MIRTLSAPGTLVETCVFPALWFGVLGSLNVLMWSGHLFDLHVAPPSLQARIMYLVLWLVPPLLAAWLTRRRKRVRQQEADAGDADIPAHFDGLVFQDRRHSVGAGLPTKRPLARQHLVEKRAQREDVAAQVQLAASYLFRRKIRSDGHCSGGQQFHPIVVDSNARRLQQPIHAPANVHFP